MTKKRILVGAGLLILVLAGAAVSYIGPRNVIGILRYDTRREGELKLGDAAPEVELVALGNDADAGTERIKLRDQLHGRPLVLVFGSFT